MTTASARNLARLTAPGHTPAVPRPRKRRPIAADRIQAVLAGEPIELRTLCEWIRRCNPTALALSADERERRYAVKARLQSELVLRFGEKLAFRPTRQHGVIGIEVPGEGFDGGHAVVTRLTSEARDWLARARAR